jgi:hypothetical protein
MAFTPSPTNLLQKIYLTLAQFPVLGARMRERMRLMLFDHGVLQPQEFQSEVQRMALRSQQREGVKNPLAEEGAEMWELRLNHTRDYLTDLIASQHLTLQEFEQIVNDVLREQGVKPRELLLSTNPELAPVDMVFEQAMAIEKLPADERAKYAARLHECKVVLIRSIISDQLRYINIAKERFSIADLVDIRWRKIGTGRIGGKAAGLLLANSVLCQTAEKELCSSLHIPDSFFIGSDVFYNYMAINNLIHWNDQKYKKEEEMRADYPKIVEDFEAGSFPPDIQEKLRALLANVQSKPLIVRSSSHLEDNFGTAFAGKYESIFLPNQGTPDENFKAISRAIARIYASTLSPNALLYRRSKDLQDYDERMAVLIQTVEGKQYDHYFFPDAAGVAFSRNLYRWAPQINREDGFVRLVWGLGTRAVDRVGNDYPRLIALSHPLLHPNTDPEAISRYSQHFIDLIDLKDNQFKTVPVSLILSASYPALRYVVQSEDDGFLTTLRTNLISDPKRLVLTFNEMLQRTAFAAQMRSVLRLLETAYRSPVDVEFTVHLEGVEFGQPRAAISILQCRPLVHMLPQEVAPLPSKLNEDDVIFSTHFMVPQGAIHNIEYVVFVPPQEYYALPTMNDRQKLARTIGKINEALKDKATFICVGPGRWGSSNSDLGVPIGYGDIYNSRALIELSGMGAGPAPEPSLGTHFFQDLLEANIYPLAVLLDDHDAAFNQRFFYETPNCADEFIQVDEGLRNALRLIRVADYRPGSRLEMVMNDEQRLAVAFLAATPS